MKTIYAVSLSFSQSEVSGHTSAHIYVTQEDTSVSMALQWDDQPEYNSQLDPGTWLYRQLSHIVENFDEHTIMSVKLDGVTQMEVEARG